MKWKMLALGCGAMGPLAAYATTHFLILSLGNKGGGDIGCLLAVPFGLLGAWGARALWRKAE